MPLVVFLQRQGGDLDAVAQAELFHDVAQVIAHGVFRQGHLVGDGLVGLAFLHVVDDFHFARGQRRQGAVVEFAARHLLHDVERETALAVAHAADGGEHLVGLAGLDDVAVDAGRDCFGDLLVGVGNGEHDDLDAEVAQVGDEVEAVGIGQRAVEQRGIGALTRRQPGAQLGGVGQLRGERQVRLLLDVARHAHAQQGMIVDENDVQGGWHWVSVECEAARYYAGRPRGRRGAFSNTA